MLPYAEALVPRWKKLAADSIPASFHFSNFGDGIALRHDQFFALCGSQTVYSGRR
jgi:hypothetical protein